jgi:hypothetical protein
VVVKKQSSKLYVDQILIFIYGTPLLKPLIKRKTTLHNAIILSSTSGLPAAWPRGVQGAPLGDHPVQVLRIGMRHRQVPLCFINIVCFVQTIRKIRTTDFFNFVDRIVFD